MDNKHKINTILVCCIVILSLLLAIVSIIGFFDLRHRIQEMQTDVQGKFDDLGKPIIVNKRSGEFVNMPPEFEIWFYGAKDSTAKAAGTPNK